MFQTRNKLEPNVERKFLISPTTLVVEEVVVVVEEVVVGLQVAWVVQGLLVVLVVYLVLVVLASTLVLLGLVVASQAAKVCITCVVTEDGEPFNP